MKPKILIVDENSLTAENLSSRLASFAETAQARDLPTLEQALTGRWSAVVTAWTLGAAEGVPLIRRLVGLDCPVFLYTGRSEIVDGQAWKELGLAGAFTHLQRADLVLAVEAASKSGPLGAGLTGPAFLLIEDSATMRQFLRSVLLQAHPEAEIIEAEDGRKALAAMKSNRVSVIITDLQMPGMDGLSFIQLLQNNAVLKRKPVLVLSGNVNDEVRASLGTLAKVQILSKPSTPQQISDAVRLLLA